MMFIIKEAKKKRGLCCANRCKKKHKPKDKFCAKHRHIFTKHNDPIAYTFYTTMSNAKRRGKEWNLTIVEFREFCEKTNYHNLKGRSPRSYSIDRKDNSKGYSLENIRCITVNENSSKGSKHEEDEIPF